MKRNVFMIGLLALAQTESQKIEPYNEFAGPDYVLWFAIYVGEEIVWRVNGCYVVEVGYGK